jgi:hypothetical protein
VLPEGLINLKKCMFLDSRALLARKVDTAVCDPIA